MSQYDENTMLTVMHNFISYIDLPEALGEENKGAALRPNFERPGWRLRVGGRWWVESKMPDWHSKHMPEYCYLDTTFFVQW